MKNDVKSITDRLAQFRDDRDWGQFHTVKELIVSLNLEASELLELTQWTDSNAFEKMVESDPEILEKLKHECADVFLYLLLIANQAGIDILKSANEKISINEGRYPVSKSRGTSAKYTKL